MTLPEPTHRAEYVEPPDLPARLQTNWQQIAARQAVAEQRPSFSLRWPVAAGATGLAVACAAFFLWPSSIPEWQGPTLTAQHQPRAVRMQDGSEILAQPESRMVRLKETDHETSLRLTRGQVTFEVTKNPARAFIVWAEDIEVRVVGTRFSVARTDRAVDVVVERGAVDVRHDGRTVRLGPGDRQHFDLDASASESETPTKTPATDPASDAEPKPAPEASEDEVQADPPSVRRGRRRPSKRNKPRATAKQLFREAQALRGQGAIAGAIERYQTLIRRFPKNSRAHLAAMEIGRLEMDERGNYQKAIAAFRKAMKRGRRSPLREDAMARIVRAYAALGQKADCVRAKNAYLDDYPQGRHTKDVRQRCRP